MSSLPHLQARIARLKSRPLAVANHKPRRVVIHRCFSQIDGQVKPDNCPCSDRALESEAYQLVCSGNAEWYKIVRNGKPITIHSAIVIRQTAAQIEHALEQKRVEQQNRFDQQRVERFAKTI